MRIDVRDEASGEGRRSSPDQRKENLVADQQLMERCIKECLECVDVASRCADNCLQSEQVGSMAQCIRLCLDCADLGAACAEMMGCNSQFSEQLCAVMADLCDACADECERHGGEGIMGQCAETCRRCAETCRQMQTAAV